MDTAHRRMEIISILSVKGHITSRELTWELGVTIRTIHHDIFALTFDCQVFSEKVCWMSFLTIRTREPITNPMCPR
ncbi:HTH domain-containing protein [Lachnospiraceae bacterium 38-14]|uniref:HTH domain-containing protein n=1 Tax=Roseburia sp. 1XD42-69 TaxID=2320088 RepID=UPI000EA16BC3|nr:HTH domain-containing protein [Roseburia sp. 1XD42-69]RKJ68684.1 HTH domain-containing protein [Roseburia sp. 1XD42-69]